MCVVITLAYGTTIIFKTIAQSLLTVSMYSLWPNGSHVALGRTSRLTGIRDLKKHMQFRLDYFLLTKNSKNASWAKQ
jgi:hypothetical protein